MHGGYMRVAVKSPGTPWEHMWVENKLDTLQHIVGETNEKSVSIIVVGSKGMVAFGTIGRALTDLPEEIMKELVG